MLVDPQPTVYEDMPNKVVRFLLTRSSKGTPHGEDMGNMWRLRRLDLYPGAQAVLRFSAWKCLPKVYASTTSQFTA